jgi:hypothetical protein
VSPNGRGRNDEPQRGLDLTVWGISDSELLHIVDDLADENGWTSNLAVRMQLGEDVEAVKHSGVGSRMAWMRRYGWLERADNGDHRLTAMGHAVIDNPDLSRAVANALEKLNPAQRVRLTRELAQGGAHSAAEVQVALRREWQRNLQTRRA